MRILIEDLWRVRSLVSNEVDGEDLAPTSFEEKYPTQLSGDEADDLASRLNLD